MVIPGKLIIQDRKPSGRFGNHLFQFYFGARLARKMNGEFLHPTYLGANIFPNLKKSPNYFLKSYAVRIGERISQTENRPLEQLESGILGAWNQNMAVRVEPGVMDPYFFELPMIDPNELLSFDISKFQSENESSDSRKKIIIHFRGTDFYSWNKNAIMGTEYYMDSLEYLKSAKQFNDSNIEIITDDPHHIVCKKLALEIGCSISSSLNPFTDFYKIMNSNAVVSSPSSFCFWGSVLGQKKIVIQSKKWLDSREMENDDFWIGLRENRFPFFITHKEI
jgi:hypothetical protein